MMAAQVLTVGYARKGRESDKIELPKGLPVAQEWIAWKQELSMALYQASPVDPTYIAKWLNEVRSGVAREALRNPGPHLAGIDQKLAAALTTRLRNMKAENILYSEVVDESQRIQSLDPPQVLAGREILLMILDRKRCHESMEPIYRTYDVVRFEWMGDEKIAEFNLGWNRTVREMRRMGEGVLSDTQLEDICITSCGSPRR